MLIQSGIRIPPLTFAEIMVGEHYIRQSYELLSGKWIALIGVDAPFLPVCTQAHWPKFVEMVLKMFAFGFDIAVCIFSSDPWSFTAWRKQIDPDGRLWFLSDGNLDFGRACCLTATHKEFFLGTRLASFSMIARDRVIK